MTFAASLTDSIGNGYSFNKKHAVKCSGDVSVRGGIASAHCAMAYRHRVRKVHPDGGSMGLGTSPVNRILP